MGYLCRTNQLEGPTASRRVVSIRFDLTHFHTQSELGVPFSDQVSLYGRFTPSQPPPRIHLQLEIGLELSSGSFLECHIACLTFLPMQDSFSAVCRFHQAAVICQHKLRIRLFHEGSCSRCSWRTFICRSSFRLVIGQDH